MKREKPIKKQSFEYAVNQIPFEDAVSYVKDEHKTETEEEMAGKLGIPIDLFRSYLDKSELPPDDLAPRLLGAYNMRIHRRASIVSSRPSRPPEPPPLD